MSIISELFVGDESTNLVVSQANVLRGSSRVPAPRTRDKRVTNP